MCCLHCRCQPVGPILGHILVLPDTTCGRSPGLVDSRAGNPWKEAADTHLFLFREINSKVTCRNHPRTRHGHSPLPRDPPTHCASAVLFDGPMARGTPLAPGRSPSAPFKPLKSHPSDPLTEADPKQIRLQLMKRVLNKPHKPNNILGSQHTLLVAAEGDPL